MKILKEVPFFSSLSHVLLYPHILTGKVQYIKDINKVKYFKIILIIPDWTSLKKNTLH